MAWYSAKDLAGKPGMPGTVQNVLAKAKRERWKARPRRAVGGGSEFWIDEPSDYGQYFTIPELAKHLGMSDRAVLKRARIFEGARKREFGKGYEFPVWGLPVDYRQRLAKSLANESEKEDFAEDVEPEVIDGELMEAQELRIDLEFGGARVQILITKD